MDPLSTFGLPLLLLALTLVFGLWVSKAGKPYNGLLFNFHKLIALAAVIYFSLRFYPLVRIFGLSLLVPALLTAAGICVLGLFASGALMSAGKLDYERLLLSHRVAPVLLVLALAGAIYLLA